MGDFNITLHVSTFLVLSVRVVRALEYSQCVAAEFGSITMVALLPRSSATVGSSLFTAHYYSSLTEIPAVQVCVDGCELAP